VQETNLTYIWDAEQGEWVEQGHGEDAVGDQWNMNSWYGVWQKQTFSGNATASIVCITTEPLYWALTVSESTAAGGDLGINGDHIDILKQSAPSEIPEDEEKFVGGFAAKFSGFFQAAVAKINGLFSLVKGCQDEEAALEERIDVEAGSRETADDELQEKIDGEAAARRAGDSVLEESIDAEVSAREAADAALQTKINNEAGEREARDEELQEAIDAEASARETADAEKVNIADVETGYTPAGALQIAGITGETEMNNTEEFDIYTHYLKINVMNGTEFVLWLGMDLNLNDDTPFTAETFWQWLAGQGFTSEKASKPINARYTTGTSSLDVGAIWVNAAQMQLMITTISTSGPDTRTIALSGKTTTVDDFVKGVPYNVAAHRHGFKIEDMSGGFVGTPASRVLQAKAEAGAG
jgi:hypothetical protein